MSLTVIEAARISAIVEEALEKLSFLASITPDVMAHRDELSQIVGDEVARNFCRNCPIVLATTPREDVDTKWLERFNPPCSRARTSMRW